MKTLSDSNDPMFTS